MTRADAAEYFVVLTDGVQRIGEVAADLIRFTDSHSDREIAPSRRMPSVLRRWSTYCPLRRFPTMQAHRWAQSASRCCARSGSRTDHRTHQNHRAGGRRAAAERGKGPMTLAQADGDGPNVDAVFLPPGRSAYVRSTGITGDGGSGGPLYLVNDSGVLFGVHDENAAKHLGLTSTPVPAPWPVLALLPRGPELSIQSASVVRDGVAPSS